jgi:hypothetical protein
MTFRCPLLYQQYLRTLQLQRHRQSSSIAQALVPQSKEYRKQWTLPMNISMKNTAHPASSSRKLVDSPHSHFSLSLPPSHHSVSSNDINMTKQSSIKAWHDDAQRLHSIFRSLQPFQTSQILRMQHVCSIFDMLFLFIMI